jgi:hypothetical protein
MLPTERRHESGVAKRLRIGELALDDRVALDRLGEAGAEAQASAFVLPVDPYFWRKRSTRPAVSIIFCLPVKNGWQLEQMSVWISAVVERVTKVLPHAHFTVAAK